MSRYRDRRDDLWDDDDEDILPRGKTECPNCGDIVPEDHLDTDSGNCVDCENREDDRRDEEEEAALAAPYALCLTGLQPKKKKRG